MKKIQYIIILGLLLSVSMVSCLKEDIVEKPSITGFEMFMVGKDGKDSLITQPIKGKALKIVVYTKADICTVWPGGTRDILKKKKSLDGGVSYPDSLDMFNHPVLKASDCYIDYGLVGAKGLKTSQTDGGWYCSYTYKNTGSFDLSIVVTNHGYSGPDYQQVVIDAGKITVK